MVFLVFVLMPPLRSDEFALVKLPILEKVVYRFRNLGWFSLFLLLGTGLFNASYRQVSLVQLTGFSPAPHAGVLPYKFWAFVLIVALSFYHDFVIGPRSLSILKANPEALAGKRLNKQARIFGILNMLLSFWMLYLGVTIVRG